MDHESMGLKETIVLMSSDDYKERFKAEYYQTEIRYKKLMDMLSNWDKLDFVPTCDKSIYLAQLDIMNAYLGLLKYRALQEGVDL